MIEFRPKVSNFQYERFVLFYSRGKDCDFTGSELLQWAQGEYERYLARVEREEAKDSAIAN